MGGIFDWLNPAPAPGLLTQPLPDPGGPASAPAVPQFARPFLDAIASGESPAYNIRYNGGRGAAFDSFADHPRVRERITSGPYRGQTSDAAGRYQMLSRTWDGLAQQHGLKDFSPESQDYAAWQLANNSYRNLTRGGDLSEALQAGQYDNVAKVLGSEWASIGRNPQGFVTTLRKAYTPPEA